MKEKKRTEPDNTFTANSKGKCMPNVYKTQFYFM